MTIDLTRSAPSTWTLTTVRPGGIREAATFTDRDAATRAYEAARATRS